MRVSREEVLRRLESVSSGLSRNEVIEQSNCFVFKDGMITTFNDEVACRVESPLDYEGAVPAKAMLELMSKYPDDELVFVANDAGLLVKGKKRRSQLRAEVEVSLPVDEIELPGDDDWAPLPEDFGDAIRIVSPCASKDEAEFAMTCIHVTPKWAEATDRFQICRYPIKVGIKKPILLKTSSVVGLARLEMKEFCCSEEWVHFRNDAGLMLSCRLYIEDFPKLSKHLSVEGKALRMPSNLEKILDMCEIFSSENVDGLLVRVVLGAGKIKIEGHGPSGWHAEQRKVSYNGEELRFSISPGLLIEITKRSSECQAGPGWLKVDGDGKFVYITSTNQEKR